MVNIFSAILIDIGGGLIVGGNTPTFFDEDPSGEAEEGEDAGPGYL